MSWTVDIIVIWFCQVDLHTDLEQKLPSKLLAYVDKTEMDVYPNCQNYRVARVSPLHMLKFY